MSKTTLTVLVTLLAPMTAPVSHAQAPRLIPVATIGCESCSGTALFTRIQAVSVGPGGEILVADNSAPVLRIFDSSGRPITAVGRLGMGPGELRSPIATVRHADRSFSIVDLGRRAILRLDSAGNDRGIIQLDGFPTAASFASGGNIVLLGLTSPRAPALRLLRVAADGKPTDLLTVGATEFPLRGMDNAAGLSIAMAGDGSFAVGDGSAEYVIRRYSAAGAFTSEIRRDIAKVKRTREEVLELAQARSDEMAKMQQMTGRSAAVPPVSTTDIPVERNYFDSYALQFDEKGRLWVRTERAAQGSTLFDVFDSGGRFLGEVKVDHAVKDFALGAGLLAGVTSSPGGAAQVRVWKVE